VIVVAVIVLTTALFAFASADRRQGLTVFAAASLTGVAPSLEAAFEAIDDADLRVTFGGSSLLAAQIALGAPADVFLSASAMSTEILEREGIEVRTAPAFAVNEIVIAVPAGNPLGIAAGSDLVTRRVAACDPAVPCGAAAATLLREWGATPITLDSDVKAVVGKVALGEVDAGLVYRTDVLADQRLTLIEPGRSARTTYVALALSPEGERFARFMRSEAAQRLLRRAGFQLP